MSLFCTFDSNLSGLSFHSSVSPSLCEKKQIRNTNLKCFSNILGKRIEANQESNLFINKKMTVAEFDMQLYREYSLNNHSFFDTVEKTTKMSVPVDVVISLCSSDEDEEAIVCDVKMGNRESVRDLVENAGSEAETGDGETQQSDENANILVEKAKSGSVETDDDYESKQSDESVRDLIKNAKMDSDAEKGDCESKQSGEMVDVLVANAKAGSFEADDNCETEQSGEFVRDLVENVEPGSDVETDLKENLFLESLSCSNEVDCGLEFKLHFSHLICEIWVQE